MTERMASELRSGYSENQLRKLDLLHQQNTEADVWNGRRLLLTPYAMGLAALN